MKKFRDFLQKVVPLSGDILLGVTKIRRQPIAEVNVPKGASVMISNNRHTYRPCQKSEIKQRQDALLGKDLHYKLFSLNCEHFATFVRYGVAVCNQVKINACFLCSAMSILTTLFLSSHPSYVPSQQIPARTKNKKSKEATQTFQRLML